MEATILLGILGAGYLFNKSEVDSNNKDTEILDEKDIYKSHYFKESDIEYKKKVIEKYFSKNLKNVKKSSKRI